jgi:hypothetical protein
MPEQKGFPESPALKARFISFDMVKTVFDARDRDPFLARD